MDAVVTYYEFEEDSIPEKLGPSRRRKIFSPRPSYRLSQKTRLTTSHLPLNSSTIPSGRFVKL